MSSEWNPDVRTVKELAALLGEPQQEGESASRTLTGRNPALKRWLAKHQKAMAQVGLSMTAVLPIMAQAAAEQLESGSLRVYASVDELLASGFELMESGRDVLVMVPDGTEVMLDQGDMVFVEGVAYVPVPLPSLPAELLAGTTPEGLPTVLIRADSIDGVLGVAESTEGGILIRMADGNNVYLEDAVFRSGIGDAYLAPVALDNVVGEESALAMLGTQEGFPWVLAGLAAIGAVGVAAAAGDGSSGSGSGQPFDTIAPEQPLVTLQNDTGPGSDDGVTTDPTVVIQAEPGSAVEVYVDGTYVGDATEDPQNPGAFSYTPSGLPDGDYEITVTATDAAGNTSQPSAPLNATLDTQAPAEANVALAQDTGADDSDGITSNGTINVSGVESGANWQYSTDGGTSWTDGTGTAFTPGEGDYAAGDVQVRVVDTAGNAVVTSLPELKIDQTAPAQATVVLANDTGEDGQDNVTSDGALTITAEPGATVQVYNGQTLLGEATEEGGQPGTFTFDAGSLPDGAYTITVTATDSAGNSGAESAPLNIQLDTTAPVSPTLELASDNGDSATDGITNNGEVQVSGIEAGANWQYSTDGGTSWTDGTGTAFTLPEGDYPANGVQVRQIDGAGNTSQPASLEAVAIDTTEPTVAIDVTGIEGLAPGDTGIVTFAFSEAPYDFSLMDVTRPTNLELTDLQAVNAEGTVFQAVARTINNTGINGERITVDPDWQDLAGNPSAQLAESAAFGIATVNPLIVGGIDQHFSTVAEALDYSSAGDTLRLQLNSYDITGLTPDQQNALELLSELEMGDGARLQLTADQADGSLVNAEDTSSIVITGLGTGDYDFTNLSVVNGKIATTVDADLTVGGAANLGDLIIGVNAGATVTMTAAQASGRRMTGEGNVEVTDLEATLDADLSAISLNGTITASFEDPGANRVFTGQLGQAAVVLEAGTMSLTSQADVGNASFQINTGAGLLGTADQLDGVSVSGTGSVEVSELTSTADLSGMASSLTVNAWVIDSIDLRGNPNLVTVDLYRGNSTIDLTLSAAQADDVSILNFGSVAITDLAATPNASFTGVNSPTTVQVTNDVTFTGDLGSAAVTVSAGHTLTTDAGKVSGLDISGSGTLALTGTIDDGFDPSSFTIDQVDLTGATLDAGLVSLELESSSQFTLLPEQVSQLDLTGNGIANTLVVDVSGLDYSGGTVDLSNVVIDTLGGDDLVRFDFGAGDDTRTLRPVGTLELGDGIDTLEISNGTIDLSGLTITGLENFIINSNITIAADTFADLLAGMDPTTGSGLFGSGTITVTGTLSGGRQIDLNQLGQFEPGGITAPTIEFPAGYSAGNEYLEPNDTGSLLKIVVGGNTDTTFNGEYTPDSATVYTASQLVDAVGVSSVLEITLANDITLNEPLDASRIDLANDLTFDFSEGDLLLGAGGELTLSAAQADTAIVGGTGTVIITGASGTLNSDFSGLTNDNVTLQVSDPLDVTQASLDGINYNVQTAGELTVAASQLSGSALEGTGSVRILLDDLQADLSTLDLGSGLDVTTVVNSDSGTGTFTGSFGDTSVGVENGAVLTTAAARLDGVQVSGGGDVIATNPAGTLDLSGVNVTGGQTISVTQSGQEVSGDLGSFSVNVADGVTFTVDAGTLDGVSVSGAGDLVVAGLDATNGNADFSGVSNTGATTFVVTGSLVLTSQLPSDSVVTVNAGQTLTLASDLLTDQVVLGNGDVTVQLADGQAGLSLILTSGDTLATVAEQTTLDLQSANLGDVPIIVAAGSTITLTAEQANGRTVTGDGAVEIVGLNDFPEADLSGILTEIIQEVPTITINPVTADDLVNQAEANSNVTVSGQVTNSDDAPLQNLTVTVLLGTMVYSATTDASGEWAVNVPKNALYDLGDGEATLAVQVINEQGNQGEVSDTFTIDITAPARPQISLVEDTGSGPADLVTTNGKISVDATEAQWEFTTDGGQTWTAGNGSGFTLPEGAYGNGDVQVRQVDDAGNVGKSASLGATQVDTTAPAAPEIALAEDTGDTGDGVTTNGQINVSGLETGASWEYSTDGGSSWTSGEGTSFELTPGFYSEGQVQVRQTDLAGNTGEAAVQPEVTVEAPVINQTTGEAYTSLSEAVAAAAEGDVLALNSGEFAEDVVIDKSLTLLGANAGEAPVDANGDPLPDLADGVRSADESWINGKITVAAPDITIDGVRLHNPDGPLDWDESVLGNGGSLDNFQLVNSYLTGYTGTGAPRFNGDGDYNGPAVADGWVIENNFIGGMTDGTGGALYLSGLSNSSVSDNTFWRPAAGHMYVSSLTNTDIDNNNFYHGVHAGGADFDGLLAELQADNGFGYGEYATDGYGYGSDGYGSDGYGDTFFGRNFWIEVKGTNDGISISGNEGQYNSGGIQLFGEGGDAYTFDNITISNNQFRDFINADPEGVLGDGRAQSGFNGAISVSIREGGGHEASNLVITGNTINAAVDQIYSDRDVTSLIYLQGGIDGVEIVDNSLDWGASSASVQQLLSELGVTASAYEGNLNGSSLYGGIGGIVTITGNSLSVDDAAASDIGQISGFFVLEDFADIGGPEGFGLYLAETTIDGTNSFEGLDPQSDLEVLAYGFTQQQIEQLFKVDDSLQFASVPDDGAQAQSLAMSADASTGDELLMGFTTQADDSATGDELAGEPMQFLIAGDDGTTLLDLSEDGASTESSLQDAMALEQGQWLYHGDGILSDEDLQAQALV
jgi:Big-like domain-containing protein